MRHRRQRKRGRGPGLRRHRIAVDSQLRRRRRSVARHRRGGGAADSAIKAIATLAPVLMTAFALKKGLQAEGAVLRGGFNLAKRSARGVRNLFRRRRRKRKGRGAHILANRNGFRGMGRGRGVTRGRGVSDGSHIPL